MNRIQGLTLGLLAIGYWLFSSSPSLAAFTAYNDSTLQSGDPAVNLTTNNFNNPASGALVNFANGANVGVTVTLTPSNGYSYFQYNNTSNPPVGSDAYNVFNGKIGTTNYQVISLGTSNIGPYTIRFTGLDSNSAYSFVYVGTRGFNSAQYLDRIMSMTVADVDLFTNNSTAGGTNFGRYQADDSNERAGGNINGEVWRFDGLKSGVDGDMQFELYARGTNGQAANIYFGGFMLQAFDGTNVGGGTPPPSGDAYWKGLTSPPGGETAWRLRTYVASNWLSGSPSYWYGDTTNGTQLTDMINSYCTLYARIPFVVTNLSVQEITLTVDYDDAFAAWIDGTQVAASSNAPVSPSFSSLATGSHESSIGGVPVSPVETFHVTSASLVLGTNYLAIQGYNVTTGSSDFVLSPSVTVVYTVSVPTNPVSTNTIKIMCIGDSITQTTSNYPSYRYWLWKLLTVSNNYNVDFIGANTTGIDGPNLYPDFDSDHAGYWGWAAWEVDIALHTNGNYYSGSAFGPNDTNAVLQTNNYYGTHIPDIVLIHLGHNDIGWKQLGPGITNATNSISILIDHLRQRNTNMVIMLAQNIPVNPGGPGFSYTNDPLYVSEVSQLGAAMPTLAASKTLASSPVVVVDQRAGFDTTNDTWSSDGTHLVVSGEKKVAAKWFTALQSWLPNLTVTNDADTNGMSDGWEVAYFGHYGQSPTADADGDGLNNRAEYIIGSSPLMTNAPPTFRDTAQWGGFAFGTVSQRVYEVDYRTNLLSGAWQLYTNFTGDGTEKSLTTSNAVTPGAFYRFKVRMAP